MEFGLGSGAGAHHSATVGVDNSGSIIVWDGLAPALFGYSPEEALGRRFSDLVESCAIALPGFSQIREHCSRFGAYHRFHLIRQRAGRYILALIFAIIDFLPDGTAMSLLTISATDEAASLSRPGGDK